MELEYLKKRRLLYTEYRFRLWRCKGKFRQIWKAKRKIFERA